MTPRRRAPLSLLALCLAVLAAGVAAVLLVDFRDDDDHSVASRLAATVTATDNGGEITVRATESFIVDLEGSPDSPWGLPLATTEALARVATSLDPDGTAKATFVALEAVPGATVGAERVPVCRDADPPCEAPTERFEITVRVVG